jgi:hypothetical protein
MSKPLPKLLGRQYLAILDRLIEQEELAKTAPTQKEKDAAKARASATQYAVKQFMNILTGLGYSLKVPNNSSSNSSSVSSLTSFSSSGSRSSSGSNTHKSKNNKKNNAGPKKGGTRRRS